MYKRMLRSALAAAFSIVVAFGALGGLAGAKGDAQADSSWRTPVVSAPAAQDSSWVIAASGLGDSSWKADDSSWAVES
jgi:hypothetical protein